jgi:hypothetical protein
MQLEDTDTFEAVQPVVTITTPATSTLLPALLVAGASVMLQRDTLAVRGLTVSQVAALAAALLAPVTDLTTSSPAA